MRHKDTELILESKEAPHITRFLVYHTHDMIQILYHVGLPMTPTGYRLPSLPSVSHNHYISCLSPNVVSSAPLSVYEQQPVKTKEIAK